MDVGAIAASRAEARRLLAEAGLPDGVVNIVTGVGFLAGGVILKDGANVRGLNTAATIWASAAVGCLAGIGLIKEAAAGAGVILILNSGLGYLVDWIDVHVRHDEKPPSTPS